MLGPIAQGVERIIIMRMHDAGCVSGEPRKFRVTLPERYRSPGCAGFTDPSGREGHFIEACCKKQAAISLREREGHTGELSVYDVQEWP